jgi:hypothetical protein
LSPARRMQFCETADLKICATHQAQSEVSPVGRKDVGHHARQDNRERDQTDLENQQAVIVRDLGELFPSSRTMVFHPVCIDTFSPYHYKVKMREPV